jgi:PKD repeat protein
VDASAHTYVEEGTYTVYVTLTHAALPTLTTPSQSITVLEELLPDGSRGTANQRFVSEVYRDLLNRPVDAAGLSFWSGLLDQGVPRGQVVQEVENSQEYRADEVQVIYHRYLHRAADPSGLATWTAFLGAGGTVEQVAAQVISSDEYFRNFARGRNQGFLETLYQDVLNRAVDPTGQAVYGGLLAQGGSRAQVAAAVLGSGEYQRDLVESFYTQYLGRTADAFGLNSWSSALGNGLRDEQLIAALIGSGEFFNKTAA